MLDSLRAGLAAVRRWLPRLWFYARRGLAVLLVGALVAFAGLVLQARGGGDGDGGDGGGTGGGDSAATLEQVIYRATRGLAAGLRGVWLRVLDSAGAGLETMAAEPAQRDLRMAWQAVQRAPRDPAAWAALGDLQAVHDQPVAAEQAYEAALRLGTRDSTVLARLGFLLYAHGQDRRALQLLERAHAGGAQVPMLPFTLAQLRALVGGDGGGASGGEKARAGKLGDGRVDADADAGGDVDRDSGSGAGSGSRAEAKPEAAGHGDRAADDVVAGVPGPCEMALVKNGGVYAVPLYINGVEAQLVFDTGASMTVLNEALVEELGLPYLEREINAITAAGRIRMATARVEELEIAGRVVEHVRVAVCDGCGGRRGDGLLGLNVQAALGMDLDLRQKLVRFADCE